MYLLPCWMSGGGGRRHRSSGMMVLFLYWFAVVIVLVGVVVVGLDSTIETDDATTTTKESTNRNMNVNVNVNSPIEELEVVETTRITVWPFSPPTADDADDPTNTNTNTNTNSNTNTTSTTTDKVCADTATCEVCNSYYTCHWCAHDTSCHAIGSMHGCVIGSTCANKKKKKDDQHHNDTNDPTGCASHGNCRDCAVASHFCHWCASDNSCHSIGSIYGCVSGVDCYDNPHCQRTQPEPYHPHPHTDTDTDTDDTMSTPTMIGWLPLLIIGFLSGTALCCITSCCWMLSCLKGAYDDLAALSQQLQNDDDNDDHDDSHNDNHNGGYQQQQQQQPLNIASSSTVTATATATVTPTNDDDDDITTTNLSPHPEEQPLLEQEHNDPITVETTSHDYTRMVDGGELMATVEQPCRHTTRTTNRARLSRHHDRRRRRRRHRRLAAMDQLYVTCTGCYMCTVLLIVVVTMAAIFLYPQKPIYNICNDSVAWKSIMDSMTSLKATAEFEILASVYNPNHIDVALDVGRGTFAHDGVLVGTYEIPPTSIAAGAITDILIVASLAPDKWEALSITAEYYRGTLVLQVDAEATIRIPVLADYTVTTSLKGIVVHVNDMSDRHLCACPTWSDTNHTTTTTTTGGTFQSSSTVQQSIES
jgi:hypothetical protein